MTLDELKIYGEMFYDSYHIPVCCCDKQMQSQSIHPSEIADRFFDDAAESFRGTKLNLSLFSDQLFLHWGYICDTASENILVIGPTFSVPLDDQAVRAFMKEHTLPGDTFDEVKRVFDRIPPMTFQQFLYILRFLNYQLNRELIAEDVLLRTLLPENERPERYSRSRLYDKGLIEGAPNFDESYRTEQMLLHLIDTGNLNELRQMAIDPDLPMPEVGNTPMSQQKTACVVVITVISRHVIRMGMDVNTAMRLSDLYLRGIDSARNTKELTMLINNAYADYSERLRALRIPAASSRLVHKCAQYVQETVNTPVSVSDVAAYVGKSASYVSTKFKSEMGCTLSSFIIRCKIEEAKSLLQHSDMSIADISSYLCFSDQCYFHRAFRKVTGETPLEYRKKA